MTLHENPPQILPKPARGVPQILPKPSRKAPETPTGALAKSDPPKRRPGARQESPKGPQETPKGDQRGPKGAQRGPKGTQRTPKGAQKTPRRGVLNLLFFGPVPDTPFLWFLQPLLCINHVFAGPSVPESSPKTSPKPPPGDPKTTERPAETPGGPEKTA